MELVENPDHLFNERLLYSSWVYQHKFQFKRHAGEKFASQGPTWRNTTFKNTNHMQNFLNK